MCGKVASVTHKNQAPCCFCSPHGDDLQPAAQQEIIQIKAPTHIGGRSIMTSLRCHYSSYIFYVSAAHLIFSSHVCRRSAAKTFVNILKLRAALLQMSPQTHSQRASPRPAQPESACVCSGCIINNRVCGLLIWTQSERRRFTARGALFAVPCGRPLRRRATCLTNRAANCNLTNTTNEPPTHEWTTGAREAAEPRP